MDREVDQHWLAFSERERGKPQQEQKGKVQKRQKGRVWERQRLTSVYEELNEVLDIERRFHTVSLGTGYKFCFFPSSLEYKKFTVYGVFN